MKKAFSIFLTILLVVVIFYGTNRLVESKDAYTRYDDFWNADTEYDVLFFGCSHMMYTALPMELWKNYGIKSYNLANGAESLPTTYWVAKSAIEKHKPQVIMVELFYAGSSEKVTKDHEALPHGFFDSMPLSRTKVDAINDLYEDKSDRLSFLFDYSLYHTRWNQLKAEDFYPEVRHFAGTQTDRFFKKYSLEHKSNQRTIKKVSDTSYLYIKKISELCNEQDIKLICVVNPYGAWEEERSGNYDYQVVTNDIGVDFIDLREIWFIDIETDSADRAHLNASGARKVTDYYGDFLTSNGYVNISDDDSDIWMSWYDSYEDYKTQRIKESDEMNLLLIELNDMDFKFDIQIKNTADFEDAIIRRLKEAEDYSNCTIQYVSDTEKDISFSVFNMDGELITEKQF